MKIPYFRFSIAGNEREYLNDVLESGWLTSSSKSLALEDSFVSYSGAKYALSVNSCTSGLHLALESLGISKGSKVLVPSWTFTASAEVIEYLGAEPVFCDVNYGTSSLDSEILCQAIEKNPQLNALVLVHFGGQLATISTRENNGILDICKAHNIKVVHDAAHAFPASFNNEKVGSFRDITCFSFYANKTITSGEGGMVLTNDESLYKRMKLMRLHGIDRDVWERFTSKNNQNDYDIVEAGFKYNLSDINAAVALAQFEKAEELKKKRQKIAKIYTSEFNSIDCLDLPKLTVNFNEHSWHLFNPVLNENSPLERDKLISLLNEKGIGTSIHYKPLHRMSFYKNKYNLKNENFPNSERLWKGCFSLPIFPDLQELELEYIIDTLKEILR